MIIRPAMKTDSDALGRLGVMLMRTHYDFDSQRFLEAGPSAAQGYGSFLSGMLEDDDAVILVAEQEGEVVGYVFAALEPLSWKELRGPAGFIHDIAVREDARRAGAARRLLHAAAEWLRDRKAPRVILWTAAPNTAAQELFRSLGYRSTMIEMTLELE